MNLPLTPPLITLSPELFWVLFRAFGEVGTWRSAPVDGDCAWRFARDLDLGCRIGARIDQKILIEEVGEEAAGLFLENYHAVAAWGCVVNAVAQDVGRIAAKVGLPIVFLKSNALLLGGITGLGSRRTADVDILAPVQKATIMQQGLKEAGFTGGAGPDAGHQLSPVFHPSGVMVEVHKWVKHMRPGSGARWVGSDDLRDAGLLRQLPSVDSSWIPEAGFLAAHALVHVVVQHWRQVGEYPLLRVVGDLIDLGEVSGSVDGLERAVEPWLVREAALTEGLSALSMARMLGSRMSGVVDGLKGPLGENLFLRHAMASRYDARYQGALRASSMVWIDSNRSVLVALTRKVRNRVLLSQGSLESRYGRSKSGLRSVAVRFWRPLDLAVKAAKFTWAYLTYCLWARSRAPLCVQPRPRSG